MKITNTFVGGKMNMDIDQRLLPKGQYFKAMNIEVINPESNGTGGNDYGDSGVLRNSLGNLRPVNGANVPLNVTSISGGALVNPRCIGACVNNQSNSIYWLITSDNEDLIVEYLDTPNVIPTAGTAGTAGAISYIARAVKPTVGGKYFNFNINYPVTGINYFNGFLLWTDNLNPPRMINVNTFKAWTMPAVNFTWNQDDINVIVKPPLSAPKIYLYNSGTGINYMQDKFLYFSYRYKYTDGRWSSIAPFSRVAFTPSVFSYNAYLGYNTGMQNKNNIVNITVDTGDRQVTDIQFLFKDSSQPNIYIIETVNKSKPIVSTSSIPNNTTWTYIRFDNSKIYATLPSSQLTRLFDNVPIRALGQDIIGSRLIYGNYTQYYDMITESSAKIIPNFTVKKIAIPVNENYAEPCLKSNRDYEFGIIYKDDYGRMSTVITSPTNTCHIYNTQDNYPNFLKNYAEINIFNRPPYWASKYSIAIKQDKKEYYNIFPKGIYNDPNDSFSYYLLNKSDINKINEGDYVIVKSDYDGITFDNTEYKIIEIAEKEVDQITTGSPAGLYFKIPKTVTNINPPSNAISVVQSDTVGNLTSTGLSYSWAYSASQIVDSSYIVYYPNLSTSIKLSYADASYLQVAYVPKDIRIFIEYAGINLSGEKCINYRLFGTTTNINATPVPFTSAGLSVQIPIKLSSTSIIYGYLKFSTSIISNLGDSWRLNLYSQTVSSRSVNNKLLGKTAAIIPINSNINAGALITFGQFHDNDPLSTPNFTTPGQSYVSSAKYIDLQEWFYEDNVYLSFNNLVSNQNIHNDKVFFRFGTSIAQTSNIYTNNSIKLSNYSASTLGNVYMCLSSSLPTLPSPPNVYFTSFSLFYQKNILLFETIPKKNKDAFFHECTEDLSIYTAFGIKKHSGNIQNQTNTLPAIVSLKQLFNPLITENHSFNCWVFPNGAESDRIKDDFNAPTTEWSPRVSIPIEDYGQQVVSEGLTYSGVYKQDSNVNNLNQFNISLGNFKYLDKSFGAVQKIKSRDTDLVVFQQDKVSKVLFGKNLLSDSTGGGQVASIPEVLGTQIAYQGEFGISNNPESFAQWDDNMFFTDSQRGAVLRLGNDGLFEISSNGMKSFFNSSFKSQPDTLKIGVFDPYYKRYILSETGFTKSQSLPSITVVNDPLDTLGSTFPLYDNPTIIISANGGYVPA